MTDLTLQLLRHGYDAVAVDRASRGGGDPYVSRLLGRRAVVVRDPEGVRTFYDEGVVRRRGAVPPPLAWLLFGRGAVHGLDDEAHRDRKLMFLEALSPAAITPLVELAETELRRAVASWPDRAEVEVHDELVRAYGRAVLTWAGLDLTEAEGDRVARSLSGIVDGFGFAGPAYLRGWRERVRRERWATRLVADVRAGGVARPGSVLAEVAASDLPTRTAGVELLNVLRPTVAVSWLGTFAVLRLAEHPDWADRVADDAAGMVRYAFAQEVRRTSPFVPVLAGRVRQEARCGEVRLGRGDLVVLDVVGIHRDAGRWPDPGAFRPERFAAGAVPGAYDLVPQGGGHPSGHRCPGESLALRLLEVTLRVVAPLGLRPEHVAGAAVDRSRMPTLPRRGLRLATTGLRAGRAPAGRTGERSA
ncbi:cytochrome P450 [Nocardioides sp. SYSU D00038]|uniref:cytochrome P450 n=1 Tax=Nocardioides sp. SYSU D00038 TaxID=2812554 RepID=UPI001967E008|nr:cytochrome P450 [Nocardioides sp. SYSU D00038]